MRERKAVASSAVAPLFLFRNWRGAAADVQKDKLVSNMEEQKREFKGIWIPKEIYLDKRINWSEKILLVEIDSLDNEKGCFSSNKYFSEFIGVTERAVTGMIAKLKDLGYISQSSFDGRRRVLHSNVKVCVSAQNDDSVQNRSKFPCTTETNFDHNNPVNNIINNTESKENPVAQKAELPDKFCGHEFTDNVKEAVTDWISYKSERREGYKPTGLKMFMSEIENKLKRYEEQDVISIISESMANNWKGICWEKLQGKEKPEEPVERPVPKEILEAQERHRKAMEKLAKGECCGWEELVP